MSDCNCKSKPVESVNSIDSVSENKGESTNKFISYFFKTIGFLFSIMLLPLINLIIIRFLFNTIVLNKKVNLKEVLQYYFKNKEVEEDNDDDNDYLGLSEDEVEMLNVEEIK